jgi:transposase
MSEYFSDVCNLPISQGIKVKQKVSGQFKTQRGAEIYAIIRSITDTCIKNNQNILSAFHTIAKLVPE